MGRLRMTRLFGIEMLLSIKLRCSVSLSSWKVAALILLLGKKFTGPMSSCTFMYLSLQTRKPVFVSLKMCLTSHTGQTTWHAATFRLALAVIEAR